MKRGFPILFLVAGLLSSCERTVDSPLDVDYRQPFLHDLEIYPESFNTDTILVNGQTAPTDIITLSMNCIVGVDKAPGTTSTTVRYSVTLPSEERLYGTGTLRDDGVSPDLNAGDGLFAGTVNFQLRRVDVGNFQVSVTGFHLPEYPSNTVHRQFGVFRSNRPPMVSGLSAPDTVEIPPSGQVSLIMMSVMAADSDGQGDIAEVFFRNLDSPSDTTRRFLMFDDGHINGVSGDSVANDGTFSIIVQLPSGTPAATFRFRFEAVDRSGVSSNTILHPLTILNP